MNKKCPNCQLVNFSATQNCRRCSSELAEVASIEQKFGFLQSKLLKRFGVLIFACVFSLFGFYLSLILSAKKLNFDERKSVEKGIAVLSEKGFEKEAFLLTYVTAFRSNDNWLNASVEKENAYAATNFPFEIMTLYPDFFTVPQDDTERAAILMHEAIHLKGGDEKEAYEFVWKHRKQLGWTKEKYAGSVIWSNVRRQTQEYSPNLFVCGTTGQSDCTE